jgi:hypothetical protein
MLVLIIKCGLYMLYILGDLVEVKVDEPNKPNVSPTGGKFGYLFLCKPYSQLNFCLI